MTWMTVMSDRSKGLFVKRRRRDKSSSQLAKPVNSHENTSDKAYVSRSNRTFTLNQYQPPLPLTASVAFSSARQEARTDLDLASQKIYKSSGPLQKPSAPLLVGSGPDPEYPDC
jgi:hypothetical protein